MINQEYLKSRLNYDPETGVFTWKGVPETNRFNKERNTRYKRMVAGNIHATKDRNTYIRITLNHKNNHAHRLAWIYMYGTTPTQVDHINGDGTDNSIKNLRDVSNRTNSMNQRMNKKNTSGFAGVYWNKERCKWQAYIKTSQKSVSLGRFDNLSDAVKARVDAEALHGFHPNHGLKRPDNR